MPQARWTRIAGQRPLGPVARFVAALLLAPPLGIVLAHAPLLLLIVLGPLGWGLMAGGFALALGAVAVMYPVMLTLGLGLALLLEWRGAWRPQPYALGGGMAGALAGILLADWAVLDGWGEILLGFSLSVYGAWVGAMIGMIAGVILLATRPVSMQGGPLNGSAADPTMVIIEQPPREP